MASKFPLPEIEHSNENTKFGRIIRILVEPCRDVLWEILISKIPVSDLAGKVMSCHKAGKLGKLHSNVVEKFKNHETNKTKPLKEDVDIGAVYTILRNVVPKKKLKPPIQGWGKTPGEHDVRITDDVERIREIRNTLQGHITTASISDSDYSAQFGQIQCIMKRLDGILATKFRDDIDKIDKICMDPEKIQEYTELLQKQKEYDEQTRQIAMEAKLEGEHIKDKLDVLSGEVHDTKQFTVEIQNDTMKEIQTVKRKQTKQKAKVKTVLKEVDITRSRTDTLENEIKLVKTEQDIQKGASEQMSEAIDETRINTETVSERQNELKREMEDVKEKLVTSKDKEKIVRKEMDIAKRQTETLANEVKSVKTKQNIQKDKTEKVIKAIEQTRMYSEAVRDQQKELLHKMEHVEEKLETTREDVTVHIGAQFSALRSAVNEFKDGRFILVAGQVERHKYIEQLALVPWTVVFDLDTNSSKEGLLSVVEDKLDSHRYLHKHTLTENISSITETSTHWVFVKGNNENPASLISDFRSWNKSKKVQSGLNTLIDNMSIDSDTTKYRIIVLWPSDDSILGYIQRLLERIDQEVDSNMHVTIIDGNRSKSSDSQSMFSSMKKYHETRLQVISLGLIDFCNCVQQCLGQNAFAPLNQFQLPSNTNEDKVAIDPRRASWLRENMEVLFLDMQHDTSPDTLKKESDNFYKGGILPWYVWYRAGPLDAERDIMNELLDYIRKDIKVYKSRKISLNHAPGSGGTTLAHRVLWEMRKETPCVQVRSGFSVSEIEDRLEFIYTKTGLPILLLLDGEEEQKFHLIDEIGHIAVVALFVKRYPYPIERKGLYEKSFWLPSHVSERESNVITFKFQNQCDSSKKKQLSILHNRVESGDKIGIYEFGLTTYTYEYKGIEAYVKGFLQLEKSSHNTKPWQNALCMLALVYHYGQTGIPCQFFAKMLNIEKQNEIVTTKDFPKQMKELCVDDTREGKPNVIRIGNFYTAKEILEQMLPLPNERSTLRGERLCLERTSDLAEFAIEFIKHAEQITKGKRTYLIPAMVTRTFISRGFKQDEHHNKEKRKEMMSNLLLDLDDKSPYTERADVLRQLADSFPDEPHYHAQLGRFYTNYRPEKQKEAESCFKLALKLCKEKSKGQHIDEMQKYSRLTFMMIYHMYGQLFEKRNEKYTGKSYGSEPEQFTSFDDFPVVANDLLHNVKQACACFRSCHDYNPNSEVNMRALCGEIVTCLLFCHFVERKGGCKDVGGFILKNSTSEIAKFVKNCIHEIDDLFLECFSSYDPGKIHESIFNYQRWYTAIFKKSTTGIMTKTDDSIQDRRIYIAQLKLQTGSDKMYGVLENIKRKQDIEYIISLYEKNFRDSRRKDILFSKRAIDLDYMEWIVAIRHKLISQPYDIENVHAFVQEWYKKLKTPQSRFYLFVLKSLIGFGPEDCQGNVVSLQDAQELKEDVTKVRQYVPKFKYPREWLGTDVGIRQLVLGSRHFGQNIRAIALTKGLRLMKGTIKGPNKNQRSGVIVLSQDSVTVNVFFLPLRAEMSGQSFVGQRVEFNIAFTFYNGYEAYNVKKLRKVQCPKCSMATEVSSQEKLKKCPAPCGGWIPI